MRTSRLHAVTGSFVKFSKLDHHLICMVHALGTSTIISRLDVEWFWSLVTTLVSKRKLRRCTAHDQRETSPIACCAINRDR